MEYEIDLEAMKFTLENGLITPAHCTLHNLENVGGAQRSRKIVPVTRPIGQAVGPSTALASAVRPEENLMRRHNGRPDNHPA